MAALPHPYWVGYLKLSLVSCPIAVYASTSSSERIAFKQINRQTGNRLRQQLVDEDTGEVIETADKARGYEVAKHDYLLIEDEDIEAVAIESSHTIDIDKFVPRDQIDQRFLDSPYYLVPNDKVGQDAFAVIREAMRGKDVVAIGRVVMAKRERIIMLQPWGRGLIGTSLRYANEVRDAATYFGDLPEIAVPADMLALGEHILDSKRADFDPTLFTDRYEDALVSMIKAKEAGTMGTSARPELKDRKVVDHGRVEGQPRGCAEAGSKAQGQKGVSDGQEARGGPAGHAVADLWHQGSQGGGEGRSSALCETQGRSADGLVLPYYRRAERLLLKAV